jgi:hypothetical protein
VSGDVLHPPGCERFSQPCFYLAVVLVVTVVLQTGATTSVKAIKMSGEFAGRTISGAASTAA